MKEAVSNKVSIVTPKIEKGGHLKPKGKRERGRDREGEVAKKERQTDRERRNKLCLMTSPRTPHICLGTDTRTQ